MRMRGYPGWFYPFLLSVVAALLLTGCLLLPGALETRLAWETPWRLRGDPQIGVLALHLLASFAMVALIGALWGVHMRAGWRHKKNWRSGLLMSVLVLVLLLSAVGLYYLADEALALDASLVHMAAGLLLPVLLVYHMVKGRRLHRH